MEDDKQIQLEPLQLGIEEVANSAANADSAEQVTTSPNDLASDPFRALALSGKFNELLSKVEPLVEAIPPEALSLEKIWWLRASVKLGTPEQFLLGSLSEVPASSVNRSSSLGGLLKESLVEFHSAGAVLLASEVTRILESTYTSHETSSVGSVALQAQPGISTAKSSTILVGDRKSGAQKFVALLFALIVLGLLGQYSNVLLKWYRGDSAEISQRALSITGSAPLSPPPLATVAAPSALDRVLNKLSDQPKVQAASGGHVGVGEHGSQGSKQGSVAAIDALKASAINWDGPIEPEVVRKAIEQGDPIVTAEDDTARRLFGDERKEVPSSPSSSESNSSHDATGRRSLGRLVQYHAIVRTIISREPKFTSPRVLTLEPDEEIFVDQIDGPFLRVRLPSGDAGYALASDLEISKD